MNTAQLIVLAVFGALAGACVGSFVCVVIDRMPFELDGPNGQRFTLETLNLATATRTRLDEVAAELFGLFLAREEEFGFSPDVVTEYPDVAVKGGFLDGNVMSPDEINKLADLESREVLLAKMAGAMKASLNNAAYLFAAPLAQAARVIDALRQKKEEPTGGAAVEEAPAETPEG